LFAKGILLSTDVEMRKLILESGDTTLITKYNNLLSNISIYNKLIETPNNKRYVDTDSLNRVIEQQEMELARESKLYGDYTHNLTISWKDVQKGLDDNDIAIEFLNFPIYNTDSTMYVALTLKKEYDSPHMVTLFEEKQLKAISEDVYYTYTDVSDLVWKPLEEELIGVKNIYFAPSGELHRIGIEYLPINKMKNISDVYTLHRLSSTRQLAVIQDETEGKNNILYGGLDYDEKSNVILTDSVSTKESILRSAFSRANVDSLSMRSSFEYLEGTKKEADMIAEDMKQHRVPYIYYSGIDGTEESFKQQDGTRPKLMHIATHGFFLTEKEAEKSKFARSKMELRTEGGPKGGRSVEDKSMTRSGLLFSGCNHAIHHEHIPDGEEDGILTAQEISMLDLRGLDLVVLSACQTGLGDIVSGEGVFGLQRGFKKAGAKTILMSLDKVNDEATRILMVEFYRNLMNGKSKYQSLKEAQKHLRQVDNGKYDDPKYWASFIMLDGLN
jgi:CHAT domain-containing protein